MRKLILAILLAVVLVSPVCAMEFTAPEAPESARELMPGETESFAEGMWFIVKEAIGKFRPHIAQAAGVCLSLIVCVLLVSLLDAVPGTAKDTVELTAAMTIGLLLLKPSQSLIHLGMETVREVSEYGKLLIPVMTGALAAQGGVTASTALYAGTVFFDTFLTSLISKLLIPMLYLFLCLAVANSAIGADMLEKLRDFIKWLMTWSLKIILYLFTGYMGITRVISGTADAAAVKAAKITISGAVPVVGGILSDASEAVLVGAGMMKNAAGIYGLLAILAVWIGPFLRIGVQYLLLKLTAAVCAVLGGGRSSGLVQDFSGAMGLLLGVTGSVCLLLLVSLVCFLKGVA